ncbi:MAG: hypothetical protein KBD53_00910 [Candidatus Omnitrophica bacterium]|nr:hypothetical protein [Candidatus Omnitrophota bacterium]
MGEEFEKFKDKTYVKFLIGCFAVLIGVTFILLWFDDLAVIFRGSVGFIIALGGLLVLYSLKK